MQKACTSQKYCQDADKSSTNKVIFCEEGACVGGKDEEGLPCDTFSSCGTSGNYMCAYGRCRRKLAPNVGSHPFNLNSFNLPSKCAGSRDCLKLEQFCSEGSCSTQAKKKEKCPATFDGSLHPCADGLICYSESCREACSLDVQCPEKKHCAAIPNSKFGYCLKGTGTRSSVPTWGIVIICICLFLLVFGGLYVVFKVPEPPAKKKPRKTASSEVAPAVEPVEQDKMEEHLKALTRNFVYGYSPTVSVPPSVFGEDENLEEDAPSVAYDEEQPPTLEHNKENAAPANASDEE
jgi:hypothetical protein